MEILAQPWPWYIAGPLIGLTVPLLLIIGNKNFGISSSMRHICAAILPSNISYFKYDWKKESWNLFFVAGILLGALIASVFILNPNPISVHPELAKDLFQYGINDFSNIAPSQFFSWEQIFTLRGFVMMIVGGFLVGFGTRYAGGCTSGHSITGLSMLQLPSLIATCCFMAGGFIMTNLIFPYILAL